ncbi:winged helix-turn-helix domain-containing protein [Brevibacterium sp. BRM-1]|uniref:winged helix-turn-helix domain-containing protein n=1 Tax=Brevibacterium sp. BRM-1 TaxID=2999062 RepID=UPI002280DF83|nr:winged helix-turn-helix domain-containing protein [Brevibacterium sp. BRM-1]WAL39228.1 winged helix-turn-helix domain-containing protein [Brevibacterium sp. BRM-1]
MPQPRLNPQSPFAPPAGAAARAAHPRSAAATRRQGPRLTSIDPNSAPRTYGPTGVEPAPRAARGIVLYIGLDEEKAAADGTNLTAVAQAVQAFAQQLAGQAETQAIIALAPEGPDRDLDAVRAVASGSPAAAGTPAGRHGPVRSRIPSRVHPPSHREDAAEPEPASVRIDIPRREVHVDGRLAAVTTKEFDLLATLVSRPGETLRREDLITALWGHGDERPDERTVDVHVRRLRKRLGSHSAIVRTIRGTGYRFDEHPDVEIWRATALR